MIDIRQKWEKEINETGYIRDETEILSYLSIHRAELEAEEISRLLAFAARKRLSLDKKDRLGIAWMKRALQLDPKNREVIPAPEETWMNAKPLLQSLTFPPIRETDNRTTKRKLAEEYIEVCRHFLEEADEHLDLLNKSGSDGKASKEQKELASLLENAIEETGRLLKASEDYQESISGVFHTSAYYQELLQSLDRLNIIKGKWDGIFHKETANNEGRLGAIQELDRMIGMESVKERVNDFYQFLKFEKKRKELGFQSKDELSLNIVLTGNPGTGKTTLARLLARIFHELGALPRETVIETNRSQLVGSFVGQTEENVRAIVEKAIGGVLFIDEAYSLKREGQGGNDYGQAAIDTLVALMTGEEYGGKFAVILAGYTEEMRTFLDANTGLRSRFPQSNHINLRDYTNEELISIAEKIALENDYLLTGKAKAALESRLERERVDETFGNARTAYNLVLDAIFKRGARAGETDSQNVLQFSLLEEVDFSLPAAKSQETPLEKLDQLVGLGSLKKEIKTLAAFVKMQQTRRDHGLSSVPIQLHSVFTGNPGTGKTTVAKIYAELLNENGFLKRGHLIVAGRADLVAGYVGQTAEKTRKKIREALGGVLFIDEAYSLIAGNGGDFGREAVDTVVEEMTKHNENLVIVLAGYPGRMDMLLESNPGLRSRFKKFYHFPDYSAEELLEIMVNYAGTYQYSISAAAKDLIDEKLSGLSMPGNGRFAVNLVDEAIQEQSLRLAASETFEPAMLSGLAPADFMPALEKIGNGEKEW